MPKKAFLHLPPETRENILQKTIRVYVEYPYEKVTLQILLDALLLHPTTFYRYFDDKDELYLYTQMVLMERYESYLRSVYPDFDADIFSFYEEQGPMTELEAAFMNTFYQLPRDVLLRAYMELFKGKLFKRYKEALRKLRASGKVYADVDDDLISYMYATTMFNLILFCREFGIEDMELLNNLKKSFYSGFFQRGVLKKPDFKEK